MEKPSQSFLNKAIQGNYAEVEMGKLAQQNGQSENAKNFGQMQMRGHRVGVTPPDGPIAKQTADYEKVSTMSGPQFDRDFAAHIVADHQKDIAEFKKASNSVDPAEEYAKGSIAAPQKQLETAKL